LGAAAALTLFQMPFSLMAMIGLVVLLGLVKKNAIMMIDTAVHMQQTGADASVAIQRAAAQRFRPIMLTTVAAFAAALPIALGLGASGGLRQPLGILIAGGLIVSQYVTLFVTPALFVLVDRIPQPSKFLSQIFRWRRTEQSVS
jgi:multidrug efflux pump subunit AcrB